jgi:geranylgeranylglycerol-phosphate geranylgeranyltransferase
MGNTSSPSKVRGSHELLSIVKSMKALILISRPHNLFITFLGVVLGALVVSPAAASEYLGLLVASIPALAIAAGGYIINDYYDLEIDRKAKPWRPLPRGDLSPGKALRIAIVLIVFGVLIAFLLFNALIGSFAALNAVITYIYSWRLKKLGLMGNIAVSLLSANSILYGGLIYIPGSENHLERFLIVLIPWSFAMIMSLSREIVKGIEDIEGDKEYGVKTLAVLKGYRASSSLATALLILLLTIVGIPFIIKRSTIYITLAVASILIFLLSTARIIYSKDHYDAIRRAAISRSVSKISLLLGTLAFIAWSLS